MAKAAAPQARITTHKELLDMLKEAIAYLESNSQKSDQKSGMLQILRERLTQKHEWYERPEINVKEVEKALKGHPEAIAILQKMEDTGGHPDMIAIQDDAYVFADCSEESPDRRNLDYDDAAKQAAEFGVTMCSEQQYRDMQKNGTFDRNTWSWLLTSSEIRKSGGALYCRFQLTTFAS